VTSLKEPAGKHSEKYVLRTHPHTMSSSEECSEYDRCSSSGDEEFLGCAGAKAQGYVFEPLATNIARREHSKERMSA